MFGWFKKKNAFVPSADEALRTGTSPESTVNWQGILATFARIMALLWLMKGLAGWAGIFGMLGKGDEFLSSNVAYQATVVYFSVIDLVAAIGLWMLAAWGGAVWLIAVASYITIATFFSDLVPTGALVSIVLVGLAVLYLVLSWQVARTGRQ